MDMNWLNEALKTILNHTLDVVIIGFFAESIISRILKHRRAMMEQSVRLEELRTGQVAMQCGINPYEQNKKEEEEGEEEPVVDEHPAEEHGEPTPAIMPLQIQGYRHEGSQEAR